MAEDEVQKEPEKVPQEAAPAPSAPAPAPEPEKPSGLSGEIVFNDSITIYPNTRIAHYDKGGVRAYAAKGKDGQRLFAMICEDHLTPRTLKAPNYAAIINPSLVKLVSTGVVHWTPAGKEKFCFIYENTLGQPLMREDTHGGMSMKQEIVLEKVIKPIINVLADCRDKEIVHGNVRLSNIYDGGSKTLERAVLGECLTMPPSYYMPALYEPIDRAMASPAGRGPGTMADDLYSFGVCLALMLRHTDPLEGMTDEQIIEAKMEEGSYVALTGKDRFTGAILELLRGLLYDDENQRWTLEEVMAWLDGRRLSPKQAAKRSKASRPVIFNHNKYMRPEILAKDLGKNTTEARHLIESGEIEQWLSRAIEDKIGVERFEKALQLAEDEGKSGSYTERLLTRVSIALHPEGPLRYKSINVMPEGIGAALTEAFMLRRDLQTYIDFFMAYYITQWIDAQNKTVADSSSLIARYDGARAYLRQKGLGGGLERCVYALNTEVHCLSEKISKYHVRSPEDLMYTYEKMSDLSNRPVMFFDRQIIAFLSAKDRKIIDPYMSDINAPETYRRILGEMKSLASIQKRSHMEKFPGISAWIIDNLEPVYERFHDRELRAETRKKAERLKEGGDLSKLMALFDNPATYHEDNVAFRKSMRRYYDLENEGIKLERELNQEKKYGKDTGRHVACVVSVILATIIILYCGFTVLTGNSVSEYF